MDLKLCVDCKYCEYSIVFQGHRCNREIRDGNIDLVTGERKKIGMSLNCEEERADYEGRCRPEGVYFKPKEHEQSIQAIGAGMGFNRNE